MNEPAVIYLQEPSKQRTEKQYDNDIAYFSEKAVRKEARRMTASIFRLCDTIMPDIIDELEEAFITNLHDQ